LGNAGRRYLIYQYVVSDMRTEALGVSVRTEPQGLTPGKEQYIQ